MINVIGLGYIGLPTALIMAANGVEVTGTDYNKTIIGSLKKGYITFEEEKIKELFEQAMLNNIHFTDQYVKADIYIIAVPTPYDKFNKKLDHKYVLAAVREVLNVCPDNATIVVESTIAPGTIDKYIRPLIAYARKNVNLAHAPERIIPGNMVYELIHNSRTIGVDNEQTGVEVQKVYSKFCKSEIVLTDIRTAEMTKVIENTYRDVNIAFANELARLCRSTGLDVYKIIGIANKHPRVNILQPGPGVGGHCISVDPWFLVGDYPLQTNFIHLARNINDGMPDYVLGRISEIMQENGIQDITRVGIYGLTYKENVDDIRESPTLQLLENMKRHLAGNIKVYDPMIKKNVVQNQYHDFKKFLQDIDLVVIMVGHQHLIDNKEALKDKIVYDTRHVKGVMSKYSL